MIQLFQRRSPNRYHRHDVRGADARMRSKMRNQRQTRFAGILLASFTGIAILGYGAWEGGQQIQRRLFLENKDYQISEIDVKNTGEFLTPERIRSYLRVKRGDNLLALDLDTLRRELELWPMVEKVEVEREIPSRLVIRVTERIPVANISSSNAIRYQIDRNGVVMDLAPYQKNAEEMQKFLAAMPDILGARVSDLKMGRPVTSPEVFQALELIRQFSRMQLPEMRSDNPAEIVSVDVSRRGMIVMRTSEGLVVKIDREDMDYQLSVLSELLRDVRQRGERLMTVDLTGGRGIRDVPVTIASAP